jgi:molybdopterin converting factor small subunit
MEELKIQVLLFSVLREKVGQAEIYVTMKGPASVEDLIDHLGRTYPAINPYKPIVSPAVNQTYAPMETLLNSGDEVALITPVSGG